METTPEAEWPDEFTREEMLEQQSRLLIEENRIVQQELSRYRKNMAKLIDMHAEVAGERDKLRGYLAQATRRLSDSLRENSSLSNRIAGLEGCREQLFAIHKAERERSAAPLTSRQD